MVVRRPPRGVLALAGFLGLFTCALFGVALMAFPMTKDPDVPLPASVAIVTCIAAMALLSAWVTWGVLRGKRSVGERLISTSEEGPIDWMLNHLLSSDEARRWFGLPPPE